MKTSFQLIKLFGYSRALLNLIRLENMSVVCEVLEGVSATCKISWSFGLITARTRSNDLASFAEEGAISRSERVRIKV